MTSAPSMPWCLLGKHPSRADFVRLHARSEAAVEWHRFLELGVELLHRQRVPLDLEPTRFVFAPSGSSTVLVGTMRASVDSAGRRFPLSAFLEFDAGALPVPLAALPFFAPEAFAGAAALLAQRASSPEPLDEPLRALPLPSDDAAPAARTAYAAWAAEVPVSELQALFIGAALGGAWYAVKTVVTACEARRKGGDAPTVECPLSEQFGPSGWLALLERCGVGVPPALLWTQTRLYAALGAPSPALFIGLTGGTVTSTKLWPTTTTQPSAIDSARAALRGAPLLGRPDARYAEAIEPLGGRR